MVDYHTHSYYSDGKSTYEEIVDQAILRGLREIGFSDHLCLHYPEWAVKKVYFENLTREINLIKETTKEVNVKFGLEVDYIDNKEGEINRHIEKFPVDYIIGSVHYVNDWNFDTTPREYSTRNIEQFYKDYFDLLERAALSGLFDIMGHIDVAKKFNYYPDFDLNPYYSKIAEIFSLSDVVFELNTSGKDKPCKEFYPNDEFLKRCFEKNVPVTLGSDAHLAKDVARYFPLAIAKLKNTGYRKIATFNKRKRSYINL